MLSDTQFRELVDEYGQQIADEAQTQFERLASLINEGMSAREAIALCQTAFSGAFVEQLTAAFSALLVRSVGSSEVRSMPVGVVPLSSRLYANSQQTSAEVEAVIREHAQGLHDARRLALQLYDGYDAAAAADRPLEGRARGELSQALRALTEDAETRKSLSALIERGRAQAERIKSAALRAAYLEALQAWEDGKGEAVLRRKLEAAMKEKNRYMAERIARTELARTHSVQKARDMMADNGIDVVEVVRNPMHPLRDICDLHAEADLWGLGPGLYPKAEAPMPPYHPHCLTGDALITASGRILSVSKRWFDGDVVVITTASGKSVTATINHPILTPSGWVGAGLLDIGDDVISRHVGVPIGGSMLGVDDHQNMPASISEIVDSFLCSGKVPTREVPGSAEDFHGDGVAGQTTVIGSDCELGDDINAVGPEVIHDHSLKVADVGEGALLCDSNLDLGLEGLRLAAHSVVGSLGHRGSSLLTHSGEDNRVLHSGGPDAYSGLDENSGYWGSADAELAREIKDGSTGPVFADKVVNIYRRAFSGHVYNLETETSHYTSNGIVSHNCLCTIRARRSMSGRPRAQVDGGVAAYLRALPTEDAARIMGSRDKLQKVLDGSSLDDVLNSGIVGAYWLRRMGDDVQNHFIEGEY